MGREAILEVRNWSGGTLKGPGWVGRPFWRSETGREAILEVRDRS